MTAPVYGSSSTNRRRCRAEIAELRDSLAELVEANAPVTVRQAFYLAVSAGLIDKTEKNYKNVVVRLLTAMRLDRTLKFAEIADSTRWMRKPDTYTSLDQALVRSAQLYRRDLWDSADAYVEVWSEKDTLAGVLYDVTEVYDVPLMVCRGYPSITYLHSAAEDMTLKTSKNVSAGVTLAGNKPVFIYYFGDHDPSGVDISRNVEARLREFAPGADITFERVAVTEDQIGELDLATRPTKRTDSRARNFKGESVEVDAIPPGVLRSLTQDRIERHVDHHRIDVLQVVEAEERQMFMRMANLEVI